MLDHDAIILHLESSTKVCSAALSKGNEIIQLKETNEGNRHSEWMTSFIDELLTKASIAYSELDAISVSEGPGSYTGLRVAYSVAKGMAFSLQIPMIGVNTLLSLSNAYYTEKQQSDEDISNHIVLPMIDARRMEVYTLAVDNKHNVITPLHAHILDEQSFDTYKEYDQIVLVGDGAFKVKDLALDESMKAKIKIREDIICSASHLHHEAIDKYLDKNFLDVAYCVPQYLKSPNITTSKKKILGN